MDVGGMDRMGRLLQAPGAAKQKDKIQEWEVETKFFSVQQLGGE